MKYVSILKDFKIVRSYFFMMVFLVLMYCNRIRVRNKVNDEQVYLTKGIFF